MTRCSPVDAVSVARPALVMRTAVRSARCAKDCPSSGTSQSCCVTTLPSNTRSASHSTIARSASGPARRRATLSASTHGTGVDSKRSPPVTSAFQTSVTSSSCGAAAGVGGWTGGVAGSVVGEVAGSGSGVASSAIDGLRGASGSASTSAPPMTIATPSPSSAYRPAFPVRFPIAPLHFPGGPLRGHYPLGQRADGTPTHATTRLVPAATPGVSRAG
ncbi:MAG TPA: hypothetical protein DEF51_27075 [Myxococcales bacterium]|nr:hypothetical protein [Myxococcales bacterium]